MVGRFHVRPGDGDSEWMVWDNAVNGQRGRCPTETEYTVHGPRDPATVRRIDPPMPVDGWNRHVGGLDAWISVGGRWLGRVWHSDRRVSFIDQDDMRPAGDRQPTAGREQGAL